jgi:putative holliday junction resolvase
MLGVDFGGTRIGIAVGESASGITTARKNLPASGTLKRDAEAIRDLAQREEAEAVIVGLPLNEDGSPSKMANICQQLAERIRETGINVFTVDESLSSVEAERYLSGGTLKASQRRKLRDGEAARLILERFFNEQHRT